MMTFGVRSLRRKLATTPRQQVSETPGRSQGYTLGVRAPPPLPKRELKFFWA